jgi:progressive ankylosis protein
VQSKSQISYIQLSSFFIPLGVSASLTSITHVIINGTLSRGEHAAFIIACYAIAMSLFSILERPMIVFRQTSSALVTDKKSFKLVGVFFIYILVATMLISVIIAFSPLGHWIYTTIFGATPNMVDAISLAFKVIILVVVFSGIRGLYQGIIITQLATNWLTIGVIARLIAMFITAYLMVKYDFITSVSGAIIFLVGMFIECLVSVYKGDSLLRKGLKPVDSPPLIKADISKFYFPLMYYFLMQTILIPVIYILLAKSSDIEMSIASFALAFSITNLILGFFMYTHQLVLQFYAENKQKVVKFVIVASIIPTLLLCLLCYTPLGLAFMQGVMGADETLSLATITVLKFFIVKTLVFPWVDFLNGFLMLRRQTKKMLFAQSANLIVVIITMLFLIQLSPQLDGVNGAIAASLGELAGLVIVSIIIYRMSDHFKKKKHINENSLL